MMNDKKKAVTAILGPEDPGVGVKGADKEESPLHSISKDLISCVKNDDHEGVADALSAAHAYCNGGMSGEG